MRHVWWLCCLISVWNAVYVVKPTETWYWFRGGLVPQGNLHYIFFFWSCFHSEASYRRTKTVSRQFLASCKYIRVVYVTLPDCSRYYFDLCNRYKILCVSLYSAPKLDCVLKQYVYKYYISVNFKLNIVFSVFSKLVNW